MRLHTVVEREYQTFCTVRALTEQLADSGPSLQLCRSHQTSPAVQILSESVPTDIQAASAAAEPDRQKLLYCERFTELLIDLLSQLPTRRFVRTLLEDRAILIKCRMSPLLEHPQGEHISHCQRS